MKKIKLTQKNAPLLLIVISVATILVISIFQYGLLPGIITTIVTIVAGGAIVFGLYRLMEMLPKG